MSSFSDKRQIQQQEDRGWPPEFLWLNLGYLKQNTFCSGKESHDETREVSDRGPHGPASSEGRSRNAVSRRADMLILVQRSCLRFSLHHQ